MLDEFKKFKVQSVLVLEYKTADDHKTMRNCFYSIAKIIPIDSDIGKAFGSMQQVILTKRKVFFAKIGLLKQLWNMVLRFFKC